MKKVILFTVLITCCATNLFSSDTEEERTDEEKVDLLLRPLKTKVSDDLYFASIVSSSSALTIDRTKEEKEAVLLQPSLETKEVDDRYFASSEQRPVSPLRFLDRIAIKNEDESFYWKRVAKNRRTEWKRIHLKRGVTLFGDPAGKMQLMFKLQSNGLESNEWVTTFRGINRHQVKIYVVFNETKENKVE